MSIYKTIDLYKKEMDKHRPFEGDKMKTIFDLREKKMKVFA